MGRLGFTRVAAQEYLRKNLGKIAGSDFKNFKLQLTRRYPSTEKWFVAAKKSAGPTTVNIAAVGKAKPDIEKNYKISLFLKNQKQVSTYDPLFWDKRHGLFFYRYIDGVSYREMVEGRRISFSGAKNKLTEIFEVLDNLGQIKKPRFLKKGKIEIANSSRRGALKKFYAVLRKYFFANPMRALGLMHGDFQAGNIIFQKKQGIAVIDWDAAMLGETLYDIGTFLAHTNLMFDYHYGEHAKRFLENAVLTRFKDHKQRTRIKFFALLTYMKIIKYIDDMSGNFSKEDEAVRRIIGEANLMMGELQP